jgi:hypothetical protein
MRHRPSHSQGRLHHLEPGRILGLEPVVIGEDVGAAVTMFKSRHRC